MTQFSILPADVVRMISLYANPEVSYEINHNNNIIFKATLIINGPNRITISYYRENIARHDYDTLNSTCAAWETYATDNDIVADDSGV